MKTRFLIIATLFPFSFVKIQQPEAQEEMHSAKGGALPKRGYIC